MISSYGPETKSQQTAGKQTQLSMICQGLSDILIHQQTFMGSNYLDIEF